MRIAYFTHSLVSCWNHGNAHFQRGVLLALQKMGHQVTAYEADGNWSLENLIADQGDASARTFGRSYPTLISDHYPGPEALPRAVDGADLVIVHEWTDAAVVREVGRLKRGRGFMLLFHDTHHRAVSDPEAIRRFDLSDYDGVLAFGQTLARVYENWGWNRRVFVWHEAADTSLFRPPDRPTVRDGAVWVGNWGDGERTAEIEDFLLAPAARAHVALDIHGVRYPEDAIGMLARYGARHHGWIANAAVPELFSRYRFTVHVPRRYYTQMLPGIPTIRVFEALACGLPLISAPWDDCEGLFRAGTDYLVARTGEEMERHMRAVSSDDGLAESLRASGVARIRSHHSCEQRAAELLAIVSRLRSNSMAA